MPIVMHVYENDLTHEYTQEWQVRVGHYAINYYACDNLTLEQARVKITEINHAMSYINSVALMNPMVPRLTWQDDF